MDSNMEGFTKDKDMGSSYSSKVITNDQNRIKLEPTKGMQVITNRPVTSLQEESDQTNWMRYNCK